MEIFNKMLEIAEDTLTYRLYPVNIDADQAAVTSLSAVILEFVNGLLADHIWHRDTFELKVAEDEGLGKDKWCMQGLMRVGDCIDDEWLAVWLLKDQQCLSALTSGTEACRKLEVELAVSS